MWSEPFCNYTPEYFTCLAPAATGRCGDSLGVAHWINLAQILVVFHSTSIIHWHELEFCLLDWVAEQQQQTSRPDPTPLSRQGGVRTQSAADKPPISYPTLPARRGENTVSWLLEDNQWQLRKTLDNHENRYEEDNGGGGGGGTPNLCMVRQVLLLADDKLYR